MLNKLSLNTIGLNRIGLNRIGKPSRGSSSGSDRPYIDPEVLASLKAVCICYGKSNDDPDRAVVKNLVDPDNPFIISNAAFKLNSGFGEYEVDFLDWSINSSTITERTSFAFSAINTTNSDIISIYQIVPAAVQSLKIKVNLSGRLLYRYYVNNGDTISVSYYEVKEGINILPDSVDPTSVSGKVGFVLKGLSSVKLEQIPSFEGAFVTDRIGDLITSTKTVQEMLGGSNEITVVSMIHQVKDSSNNVSFTNYIRGSANGYFRNIVNNYDKTGIYGYTSSDLMVLSVVNNILGDKNDYTSNGDNRDSIINGNFSVQGYSYNDGNNTGDFSSVAWYWTIIANKVLTTDQINQVIAYFNLDRTLKSDIYCNIAKQGITNENHAEFGDKLIDFSGNGRDIQLNNIAWDGDSGIGKYNYPNWKVTATIANTYSTIVNYPTVNGTYSINVNGVSELMQSIGLHLEIKYTTSTGIIYNDIKQDGVYSYILPDGATDLTLRFGGIPGIVNEPCNITITQIPSHAGALYLDGINDFGKVTGMPIYKDYTFIIDYERISYTSEGWGGAIVSKSPSANNGAFISMMANSAGTNKQLFSFGGVTAFIKDDLSRILFWQTKYKSENTELTVGEGVDGDTLWLGTLRDNDSRFFNGAIYSLMSFPYSMSEFLIERQLKKYKLGSLYPNMVEFRPIVKSNLPYSSISYSVNPGEYISVDSMVTITVTLPNTSDKLMEVSCNAISDISISGDNGVYEITGKIVKSPQNINMIISSYLTMLSNSTLISNETLIKNE